MRRILSFLLALAAAVPARVLAQAEADYGVYRLAPDHFVGVDRFINDDRQTVMLLSDYRTGVVRRLFPGPDGAFVMGPNFNQGSPPELTVRFLADDKGAVTGLSHQPSGAAQSTAARLAFRQEEVTFRNGPVTLSGTLILPPGKGPHPAVMLLHGSGPLTRWSFGPYPHFFASLGMAVLIYDKRGTGQSEGVRLDASTSDVASPRYYPDDLADDALAAYLFLQSRKEVDPFRIGAWGSSEGGMLATQVAARSHDARFGHGLAFMIDSSGFMGPLWRTFLHQKGARVLQEGGSEADAARARAFTQLWLDVGRTGKGWDEYVRQRDALLRDKPRFWQIYLEDFASLDEVQWYWKHVLSFSPVPDLKKVTCPVLALYGSADPLNDVGMASTNIGSGVLSGGNREITVKIFPGAGHSLSTPSHDRMAPGVFDTIRTWLSLRNFTTRVP